jgi:hypothetical protein
MRRTELVVLLGLAACGAPAAETAQATEEDAPPSTEEADEAPPGPLDREGLVDELGDMATCRQRLAEGLPVPVGDLLLDLGYDAALADACASVQAVRDGNAEACDALSVSRAQDGCRLRVALAQADPDACPPARIEPGRDPVCMALASRDPGLCLAAAAGDRELCEALVGRRPERCGGVRAARCRALWERYGALLGEPEEPSPATQADPIFRLTVTPEGREPERLYVDSLARGVVLEGGEGCSFRVVLDRPGARRRPGLPGGRRATFRVEVGDFSPDATTRPIGPGVTIALDHPELGRVEAMEGEVRVETLELRRGGALTGHFEGRGQRAGRGVALEGAFTTFVRDLDADGCRE